MPQETNDLGKQNRHYLYAFTTDKIPPEISLDKTEAKEKTSASTYKIIKNFVKMLNNLRFLS